MNDLALRDAIFALRDGIFGKFYVKRAHFEVCGFVVGDGTCYVTCVA